VGVGVGEAVGKLYGVGIVGFEEEVELELVCLFYLLFVSGRSLIDYFCTSSSPFTLL
jgi:hypothetical protein